MPALHITNHEAVERSLLRFDPIPQCHDKLRIRVIL
jgi:hypothetical protein